MFATLFLAALLSEMTALVVAVLNAYSGAADWATYSVAWAIYFDRQAAWFAERS